MFEKDLCLPVGRRAEFKEMLGSRLTDKDAANLEDDENMLIAVGDVVSLTLRNLGVRPDLSVYDGVTERHEMTEFADLVEDEDKEEVVNPAGRITSAMADAIGSSVSKGNPSLIHVIGEEDLALLPCVLLSPVGTRIVYGWPGLGMMLLVTDEAVRSKVAGLVALMEESE